MPLITKILPENGGLAAVWKITEQESFFIDKTGVETVSVKRLIKSEKKRMEWLAVRLLMQETGIDEKLRYNRSGKPLLEKGFISISHCFPYVVIYFSETTDVGVDIEKINPKILKIVSRFLNASELQIINQEDLKGLTIAWGVKESVYKKHGGDTVHFAKNICISSFDGKTNEVVVDIKNGTIESRERLFYQLIEDFVLVYTG